MKRQEVIDIIDNNPVIAYWDAFAGVEIHRIEENSEGTFLYLRSCVMSNDPGYHRRKILYKGSDGGHADNIRLFNHRLYLRDCLRV